MTSEQEQFYVERELKARADQQTVRSLSQSMVPLTKKQVVDRYYDLPDRRLFKAGVFVRLRDDKQLDIKYNPDLLDDRHLVCREYSFAMPVTGADLTSIRDLLLHFANLPVLKQDRNFDEALGLEEFVVIDKVRSDYRGDGFILSIDEVSGLGNFLELEATEADKSDAIDSLASQYGLVHIPVGYVELSLRANHYDLYLQGRYILSSDKGSPT